MPSISAQKQLYLWRALCADPQVRMFEDLVPQAGELCIYLIPTFSDAKHAHNHLWYLKCWEVLRKFDYKGLILVPRNRNPHGGNRPTHYLCWCQEALTKANVLIFAITKNQKEQELRQIMHQLGFALGQKSAGGTQTILVSAPYKRIPCPQTKHSLSTAGVPTFSNLSALLHYFRNQ